MARGATALTEFLYLRTGDGRDLYLQKTLGSGIAGMELELGFLAGLADPIDASVELPDLRIVTTGHRAAVGLHRWPTSWRATWTGGSAELASTTRTNVGRYGIAGFAMSVVAGQLILGETRTPLSGFGELLALGPLAKMLA